MNVIEMAKHYLQTRGYEGLCYPDFDCGCDIDDLAPCCEMTERCQAAWRTESGYIPVKNGEYVCPVCGQKSYPNYGTCAFCGRRP